MACVLAMLGAAGCTDERALVDTGESSDTGPSSGTTTSDASSSTGPSSATATANDTASDPSTGSTGVAFVVPKDDVGVSVTCDIFTQNCPLGEKCVPWANDGSSATNATRCVPVVEDPVEDGQPCHVERWSASGLDDCERGSMCWNVDYETLEGVCVGICIGTNENSYCESPAEVCVVSDGYLAVCIPICDPVEQNCLAGQACYPIDDRWGCVFDASGDMGAYGDPCVFINLCDPGLACLDSSAVPPGQACEGADGCCTEVCDITDPAGDEQCTGAAEGQTCQAWYEDGEAPLLLEHVGICALPV